jgi:hypothetical protein
MGLGLETKALPSRKGDGERRGSSTSDDRILQTFLEEDDWDAALSET